MEGTKILGSDGDQSNKAERVQTRVVFLYSSTSNFFYTATLSRTHARRWLYS